MIKLIRRVSAVESVELLQAIILFLFYFPLFFQLSGSIFTARDAVFDSQASLLRLPLPIASVFCFIGIALFLRLDKSYFGMGFVFSLFMLLMLSSIVSIGGEERALELGKFIHVMQFVLPTFALVFGSLYLEPGATYLRFESVALLVLLIIIPLEVIATISWGHTLSANIYLFSLYQHFQYLPVVFLGIYLLSATSLFEETWLRFLVIFLAPWMGIYIAQSISVTAMVLAVFGFTVFILVLYKKNKTRYAFSLVLIVLVSFLTYFSFVKDTTAYSAKFESISQSTNADKTTNTEVDSEFHANVENGSFRIQGSNMILAKLKYRINYWKFYGAGILDSPKVFLFGHLSRPDRNKYRSAHNYYLDLAYNFGFLSLLPYLWLIIFSIRKCRHAFATSNPSPGLMMHIALVGYFVFVDNFFKVGFSQPYPGMMMFFIWGTLLARLSGPKLIGDSSVR